MDGKCYNCGIQKTFNDASHLIESGWIRVGKTYCCPDCQQRDTDGFTGSGCEVVDELRAMLDGSDEIQIGGKVFKRVGTDNRFEDRSDGSATCGDCKKGHAFCISRSPHDDACDDFRRKVTEV